MDPVEAILQQSKTYAEASERVRSLLVKKGHSPTDEDIFDFIVAFLGGDIADMDGKGLPRDPLAQKFWPELH